MGNFLSDKKFPFYLMLMLTSVLILYNFVAICLVRRRPLRGGGVSGGGGVTEESDTRGLDAIDLEAQKIVIAELIPAHKYMKGSDGNLVGEDRACAICLSDFEEGEELRTLPECLHSFHSVCIDTWLLKYPNCPVCRAYQLVN